jgi:hypothetical protein
MNGNCEAGSVSIELQVSMQAMNQFIGELTGCKSPHGAVEEGKLIPRIPAPQVCAPLVVITCAAQTAVLLRLAFAVPMRKSQQVQKQMVCVMHADS